MEDVITGLAGGFKKLDGLSNTDAALPVLLLFFFLPFPLLSAEGLTERMEGIYCEKNVDFN